MAFEKHKFSGLQPSYPREEKERRGNNRLELYVKAQDFLEDSLYKLGIFFLQYDSDSRVKWLSGSKEPSHSA